MCSFLSVCMCSCCQTARSTWWRSWTLWATPWTPCRRRTWAWRRESRLTCRGRRSEVHAWRAAPTVRDAWLDYVCRDGIMHTCVLFPVYAPVLHVVHLSTLLLWVTSHPHYPLALVGMCFFFFFTVLALPCISMGMCCWEAEKHLRHHPIWRLLPRHSISAGIPLLEAPCIGSQAAEWRRHMHDMRSRRDWAVFC